MSSAAALNIFPLPAQFATEPNFLDGPKAGKYAYYQRIYKNRTLPF